MVLFVRDEALVWARKWLATRKCRRMEEGRLHHRTAVMTAVFERKIVLFERKEGEKCTELFGDSVVFGATVLDRLRRNGADEFKDFGTSGNS